MSDPPALRASDTDREQTVALLRDHAAEGRLTLEEFTERMSAAYLARTREHLEALSRDLPPRHASVASRRAPTRFLFSRFALGGHKRARGNDPPPASGNAARAHLRRLDLRRHRRLARARRVGAEDVAEVIRGIRSGAHKELEGQAQGSLRPGRTTP